MLKIRDRLARWRMGNPPPGRILRHPHGSYTFEQGAELAQRLESRFGDPRVLTCLDLGCGPGDTVTGRQVLEMPWRRLISVEAFLPYVGRLRAKEVAAQRHDICEIHIETIFSQLERYEADVALLLDVIEHFRRRDALRLLERLERFVRCGVAIFLPLGRVEQEDLDNNALQRHRSFWQARDLIRLGYDVEIYENFHGQLDPPPDAAWAIKTWPLGRAEPAGALQREKPAHAS